MTSRRVAVVGAGITGLTLGYRLRERGLSPVVLESAAEVGGHVKTIVEDGFVVEGGPNGFLDREPAVPRLVADVGLTASLVDASPESARRFILDGGKLWQVPQSPGTLLRFGAMSLAGRLRVVLEPFARRARSGQEETVFDFARRRIGREGAEVLVDTAVSGISAGDSRRLSAPAQFPLMIEMEREHGSLLRAMIARRRRGVGAPKLKSFDGGMHVLVDGLAKTLGGAIRVSAGVASLTRDGSTWRLALASGETVEADVLALACGAAPAARILRPFDPSLAAALDRIEAAPVAVSAFAFPQEAVKRPLDGYGYLVTRAAGLATLGVLWESSLFPGRAPAGTALLRVMMGGSRAPEVAALDAAAAESQALAEMRDILGLTGEPSRRWRFPERGAIAQYTLGHVGRVGEIRALAARHPGLVLCGTSYDGVSFGAAVASAEKTAEMLRGQ
ncbi:MAG TPA: protoporphyrinogen oxidase [Candidatus Polarisedimenticolaceae bacterium]|nr:protoporphyrinogen oxidase [Candidatus Polarisedimenticolaceae bacterium]